jgi:hypothetical protein
MTTVCGMGGDIRFGGQKQTLILISSRHLFVHFVLPFSIKGLFHIAMAKFPIPENCSAHVPMILKEFCSSKINGLVMKTFSGK